MPSATQIRATSVARQAVPSATSPLKLFALAAAQSDATAAATSGSIFSSFEDALNAARQQSPNGAQPQNSESANSTKQSETRSEDDGESHAAAKSDSDSAAAQNEKTTGQKIRHHSKAGASGATDGEDSGTDATDDADSAAPAASSGDATTTTAQVNAKAKAGDGKAVAGPKDKSDAPAADAANPTAAAIAVSQQIVPAAAPASAAASTKKISPPPTTANSAAATPALPTAAAPAQPDGKNAGKTELQKPANPPITAAAIKQEPKSAAPVASQMNDSTDANTPAAAPTEMMIKALPPTPATKESGAGNSAAPNTAASAPPASADSQPIPDAMQLVQQAAANLSFTPSSAAQASAAQSADHDVSKPQSSAVTTISGTGAATVSAAEDSADAAAPAQQVPDDEQDQTFQQVIQGLRGKMDPTNGKAEIRLDPPNLGTLHVSITLTNGSLTAQFQSSSDVVRDLLKSNMEKLKTVLEGQGVSVDKLAVEAPAGKVVAASAKTASPGAPNNNGRSAGQYTRDQQSGQKRSQNSAAFARLWNSNGATATEDAPIDVVG